MKSNKIINKKFSICIYDEIDKLINAKRVFFVKISKGETKGNHGHYIQNQIFFCIDGSLAIKLKGKINEDIEISSDEYVYLPKETWIRYTAIKDSYICVISDQYYDENDYYY